MSMRFEDHAEDVATHPPMRWLVDLGPDCGIIECCARTAADAVIEGFTTWLKGANYNPEWLEKESA